jgi:hypothetical protein
VQRDEELGAAVPQPKRSHEIITPMILLEMILRKIISNKMIQNLRRLRAF